MADSSKATAAAKGLGTMGLAAIVVSSMVGGGVYSLPQNMAAAAGAGAVIIAWIITGIGIFFIANSFKILAAARPNLTAGIYMYSKDGFGEYAGFTIAWGYWLCQIFGNVGYAVITMDALNYFFPGYFTGGNNIESIIGGSILIWVFNFVVLKGVQQASIMNVIGTIGKIVPLAVFIIALVVVFKWDQFTFDFWGHMTGHGESNLGGLGGQIKGTMLVTLWAFIGIEGAVVLSARAKSQKDVGRATILGFAGGLLVFVLLSVLPYGFMTQAQLAGVPNPSTAGVLEAVVGKWGAMLMNVGLLIAILSSWLSWTMITAELPYQAAKDGSFPKQFARENKNGSASVSLWVTSSLMQLAMIMVFFSNNAWNTMLSITGVMVLPPYLASTAYLWKISQDGRLKEENPSLKTGRTFALLSGVLGSIFALWLIYAAGLQYLLMSVIFLACGIPFYVWSRLENSQKIFNKFEAVGAAAMVAVALIAVYMMLWGNLLGSSPSPSAAPAPAVQTTSASAADDGKGKSTKDAPAPLTKRHGEKVLIKVNSTNQ